MADTLAAWIYGTKVATITNDRRRLRLEYTQGARQAFPGGTPLLSLTLPLTDQRYANTVVKSFLDGLLPEGDARRAIAEDLGLAADDTFGLIAALGRDCAGAIVILDHDEPAPLAGSIATAEQISDGELAELVINLRNAPLGVDPRVRLSLAGVQEKLLLTRLSDGSWGRPVDGTPSTHILKPEIRGFPNTVENEAFCMRFANHLGLSVAEVATAEIAGRKLLVVTRYDRLVNSSGEIQRLHQEDLCQATATPPKNKYQEDGGPSLRQIARLLMGLDPSSVIRLLKSMVLHVLVGNGDAHAKNYSVLHHESGSVALAPLYDVMSTLLYGDDRLAMYVDTVQRTNRVTGARLANEGTSWGLSRRAAAETIKEMLDQVNEACERAKEETPDAPAELFGIIERQRNLLSSEL
jgi:serine/threonine-protein kinase HipA